MRAIIMMTLPWTVSRTPISVTGCIDLGDVLFRPVASIPELTADTLCRPALFSHKDEKASAGYYSVLLREEGIQAELTATLHAGVHRYTFPKGKQAGVIIDLEHLLDNEYIYETALEHTGENEISGMRRTRGWVDNQYIYFVAQFSQPFQKVDFVEDGKVLPTETMQKGKALKAVLAFNSAKDNVVVAKVGLSTVSVENARLNLEREVPGFDFDAVHVAARTGWEHALSAITVEGGTSAQRTNFYTALYHALVVARPRKRCERGVSPSHFGNGQTGRGSGLLFYLLLVGHLPCMASFDDADRRYAGERHGKLLARYVRGFGRVAHLAAFGRRNGYDDRVSFGIGNSRCLFERHSRL